MKTKSKSGLILSYEERKQISKSVKKYLPINEIANLIGRSVSSTYRELKKNGGYKDYDPDKAQKMADIQREHHNNQRGLNSRIYRKKSG